MYQRICHKYGVSESLSVRSATKRGNGVVAGSTHESDLRSLPDTAEEVDKDLWRRFQGLQNDSRQKVAPAVSSNDPIAGAGRDPESDSELWARFRSLVKRNHSKT